MAGPYSLAGRGTQAIVRCDHLQVTVTASPRSFRTGQGNPTNLYDHGLITPGSPNGWYPAIPISQSPLLIPISRDVDRFGYSLLQGATANVTEQTIAAPANTTRVLLSNNADVPPGTSGLQLWTYTPAAGRMARFDLVLLAITPNLNDGSQIFLTLNNQMVAIVFSSTSATGSSYAMTFLPNPLIVYAGEPLVPAVYSSHASNFRAVATAVGLEFDALAWSPS